MAQVSLDRAREQSIGLATSRLRRRNRWAGFVVLGVGVPLTIALAWAFRAWPGRSFPGFLVGANRVAYASPVGTAARSGLPFASQIVETNGRAVASSADVYTTAAALPPGTPVHYVVRDGTNNVEVDVPTMRFDWRDWLSWIGLPLASALLCLAGAGRVSLVRPDAIETWAFLLLGVASALISLGRVGVWHPAYGGLMWLLATGLALQPAALLHLGLVFPIERPLVQRRPWMLALPYLVAVPLAAWVLGEYFADPPRWTAVHYTGWIFNAALAVVIGWTAVSYWQNRDYLVRPRLNAATPGLVLVASMGLYGLLSLFQTAGVLASGFVMLTPALIYVAIGHGITFNDRVARDVVLKRERELADQVAERTAALERALADLSHAQAQLVQSEKMASLGQLTAGLAHEINTPVTAVVSNVKPLWNEIARLRDLARLHGDAMLEASIARLRTIVEVMARGAERTASIVQDLRAFSRVGETTPMPMDLHEGIDVSLRLLRPLWVDRVAIHKAYGPVPPIEVSASHINQVLMNLLTNAFDAIEGPGHVWIETRLESGDVIVTVRDDGPGIAAEHVERVFDPFFTTKPVGKGTGLGLAISASIVRDHAGRLCVATDTGVGATFTLTLPLRRAADARSSTMTKPM